MGLRYVPTGGDIARGCEPRSCADMDGVGTAFSCAFQAELRGDAASIPATAVSQDWSPPRDERWGRQPV